MKKFLYELKKEDLNKSIIHYTTCKHCGNTGVLRIGDLIGYVMKQDIGKRIYLINNNLYIENQEQLEKRIKKDFISNEN